MDIEDFAGQALGADARLKAEADARSRSHAWAARARIECRHQTVALIASAARAQAVFNRFPTEIPLGSPNGHNRGLSLTYAPESAERGAWRVEGSADVISQAARYGGPSHDVGHFLAAMGVLRSPASHSMLVEKLWPSTDASQTLPLLMEAADRMPAHSVAAMLNDWAGFMLSVGAREKVWETFPAAAKAISDRGHDLAASPARGVPSPLSSVAERGVPGALRAFLSICKPSAEALRDAGGRAAAAGRTDTLQVLFGHGLEPTAVDHDGWNLVHSAVQSMQGGHGPRIAETVRFLVSRGVDPEAQDRYGRRPLDYLAGPDGERHPDAEAIAAEIERPAPSY